MEAVVTIHPSHEIGPNDVGIMACDNCWWCTCHNLIELENPCDDQATVVKKLLANRRQRNNTS